MDPRLQGYDRTRWMIATFGLLALVIGLWGLMVATWGPPSTALLGQPTTSPTPTLTMTPTITIAASATASVTASPTVSPTASLTATPTVSPTVTASPTPTRRPTIFLPYEASEADLVEPKPRAWGVQFPLDEAPERHRENQVLEFDRVRGLGLSSVRTNIRWDRIEPENTTPDGFDWSGTDRRLTDYSAAGFDVLVTLVAYPEWATHYKCGYALLPGMEQEWRQFVRAAAQRYSQPPYRVAAWEIGNEVDGDTIVRPDDNERPPEWGQGEPTTPYGGCWGDRAPAYKEFLRMAYEEIKAVDPDALVTHGGLAYADINDWFHMDFLDQLLAAGGGAYFDVLNYHWFPNVPGQMSGPERHRQLMATMARHGQDKPVWLTETYRLTFPQLAGEGEAQQIEFLTKELVELLAFPELKRIYWYGWVDFPPEHRRTPDDPQRGLVTHEHAAKPALSVLPTVIEYTNGRPTDRSTDGVFATRFSWPRLPHDYIVAWARDGRASLELSAARHASARADVRAFPTDLLLAGQCCHEQQLQPQDGAFRLEVGPDTVFVKRQPSTSDDGPTAGRE